MRLLGGIRRRWLELKNGLSEARRSIASIGRNLERVNSAAIESQRLIYANLFKGLPKPLACYSESNFSQNGEDGIIAEIFRRLGLSARTFVEIGAGDGTENNTICLLLGGASGLWVEAGTKESAAIRQHHEEALRSGQLRLASVYINAENVNSILSENNVSIELDLLSIDIDGNDYWFGKGLKA